MDGPDILVRALSQPHVADKFGNVWQYHSRSDHHSKVACWVILFDLLQHSSALPAHIADDKVVFGINREMRDFRTNRKKDLDLVIARPSTTALKKPAATMQVLAERWGIDLTDAQRTKLDDLAPLREGLAGNVLIALEAKACMTAHIKALPRLFDELTSSHLTVHADTHRALAVGYLLVNDSPTFLSPDMNKYDLTEREPTVNTHPAHATQRTVDKILQIDRRTTADGTGFDALGITVISLRNDGSPVTLTTAPPAPSPQDVHSYERMIGRLAQSYDTAFAGI